MLGSGFLPCSQPTESAVGAAGILRAVSVVEDLLHIRCFRLPMRAVVGVIVAMLALTLAGCGAEPQDADAPTGTWKVTVLDWEFAVHQPLGTPQPFVIKIRNDDSRTIPNLIVNVAGLSAVVYQPNAASNIRPIWMTQDVDFAHVTPYNSKLSQSFNLGPIEAGETTTYAVVLTPLRRGDHEVSYRLSPDLFGDGRVVNASDGMDAAESRTVAIDPTPVFDRSFFDE